MSTRKHHSLKAICIAAFIALYGTQTAYSEEPVSVETDAACADAPFRDFDFWIGQWDVRTPNGQVAGTNRIAAEEGGCLLVERWTGASGGAGQSYNYVDRETGLWRQIWVSSGFTIDYSGGLDEDGVMRLEGTIAYAANPDNNGPFRGAWELQDDGTVKQSFHQYSLDKEQWMPWFTGIYTRVEETQSDQ